MPALHISASMEGHRRLAHCLQCPSEPPPGVDLDYHDHKMLASVDLATMREYIERREVARDYNEISISDQYKVRQLCDDVVYV